MNREKGRGGFTLTELVVLVIILAVLAGTLLPSITRYREESCRIRCRNNLNMFAKGMATYANEWGGRDWIPCPLGRGRDPNTYNGAEWLATLYWTGVVPDPGVFICPSSGDTNRDGLDLGSHVAAPTFGSQTVSYAGVHHGSRPQGTDGRPPPAIDLGDFDPTDPMATEDTQGDPHHDGGMAILFFDSHVEFMSNTEIGPGNAVGERGGLLGELSN